MTERTTRCPEHAKLEEVRWIRRVSRPRNAEGFHIEARVACGADVSFITSAKNLLAIRGGVPT